MLPCASPKYIWLPQAQHWQFVSLHKYCLQPIEWSAYLFQDIFQIHCMASGSLYHVCVAPQCVVSILLFRRLHDVPADPQRGVVVITWSYSASRISHKSQCLLLELCGQHRTVLASFPSLLRLQFWSLEVQAIKNWRQRRLGNEARTDPLISQTGLGMTLYFH